MCCQRKKASVLPNELNTTGCDTKDSYVAHSQTFCRNVKWNKLFINKCTGDLPNTDEDKLGKVYKTQKVVLPPSEALRYEKMFLVLFQDRI